MLYFSRKANFTFNPKGEQTMKSRKLLGGAMFAVGIGCLVWAIAFGHDRAWSTAAASFCASAVCLNQCRKPSEEE